MNLKELIKKHKNEKGNLIPVLQELQRNYSYLPADKLREISQELKVPLSKIYGVATFYAQFSLVPLGKNVIRLCTGTACHVKGAERIHHSLETLLGINHGQTTADHKFTLECVHCIGACFLAPVMMVNEEYYGELTPTEAENIIKNLSQ